MPKKSSETVFRTCNCKRSGVIFTEYIRLLFCTEKIILSNKLSKRYSGKERIMTDLKHREDVLDGSCVKIKKLSAERGCS